MDKTEKIKEFFKDEILKVEKQNERRVYIDIAAKDIVKFVSFLFNDMALRFMTITCIDTRKNFELLYHFSDDSTGTIITLRVFTDDRKDPRMDSISGLFVGSAWIERELHELMGIDFKGNTNLKHLLLAEDWPKGDFPLRQKND
jgi:NADH-quinone oxidoreductase subunit C